ncbi:MAG: ABC transporter ATP-binding protein [Sulfuriflexus sp.]|nr:ABC transporter ATP-binding protein [Sulfuriflexus sp.]
MKTLLEVNNIECHYDGRPAVSDLSLQVNEGDIVCLLGPSGCGKTTVLRAIAGFENVHKGEIKLGDQVLSRAGYTRPPHQRNLGMVFQDYALFPHMNVCQNICFGLRDMSKLAMKTISEDMLNVVGLAGFGERYPHELSGGQQQRVALARALAPNPDVILLDEPFSNLDVELRERLSIDVRNILKGQGITAIVVTHDQNEAFAIGDQIGVMHEGQILQWDTAYNLYHEPENRFVADFIGQGVFLKGTLIAPDTINTEIGHVKGNRAYEWPKGAAVDLLLRPDDIVPDDSGELIGRVINKAFKGAEIMYTLQLSTGSRVLSMFPSHHLHEIGDEVGIRIAADHMVAFQSNEGI